MPRRTVVGIVLVVVLAVYLTAAAGLGVVVLAQGVPRGPEAQQFASAEAQLFDALSVLGMLITAVLVTAAGLLISNSNQRLPRRARLLVTALFCLTAVLALFVFGVAGAMGWHYFGCGNGYG